MASKAKNQSQPVARAVAPSKRGTHADGVNGGRTNGATVTYYQILGVDEQADADTLAQAYARLRRRYHPERNPGDPLAPEIIRYLDTAYAILIDQERRRAYDATLGNGASANGASPTAQDVVQDRTRGAPAWRADIIERTEVAPVGRGVAVEAVPLPAPEAAQVAPEFGTAGRRGRKSAYAERDLTVGSVPRHLWFLGWPMMVSGLLQSVDSVLDLFWAGRGFGARAIAGLGVAQQWVLFTWTLRMGLDTSTRAMVARAVGAGNIPLANHVTLQAFTLSGTFSLVFMVLGVLFTEFLIGLLGASEAVIAQGATYMRWSFVATTTMGFMWMSGSALQASGDTFTPMKAQLVSRIVHPILAPFLAFGWWWFPDMGLAGLAIANVIAQSLGSVMNFHALFRGTSRLHLSLTGYRIDWPLLWRMTVIGAPASVNMMERTMSQLILMRLISPFGDMAFAAFFLTQRVQMLSNLGSIGLGQAAGVLVGQNLGAKKPERAKAAVGWALLYVSLIKAGAVGILVAFPLTFLSLFNNQAELLEVAVPWLYILSISFLFMGPMQVFMQSFQTAGDTVMPMVNTLFTVWLVELPLALILSGTAASWTLFGEPLPFVGLINLGQFGVAWAITITAFVRLIIYIPWFFWGPWMKKEVLGEPAGRGMGMGAMH